MPPSGTGSPKISNVLFLGVAVNAKSLALRSSLFDSIRRLIMSSVVSSSVCVSPDAAGTDQADELAGMEVQIDVIQDIEGAITEIDAEKFDKWLHLVFLWRREGKGESVRKRETLLNSLSATSLFAVRHVADLYAIH